MSSSVDGGTWQKPEEMLTTDGVLTFFFNCWAEFENEAECVDNKLFNLLFEMLENSYSTREAFSMEELQLIDQNVTPFVRPIFLIGMCTGLSEGDFCPSKQTDIPFA